MKYRLLLMSLVLSITFIACEKNNNCDDKDPVCNETSPLVEPGDYICHAYFTRWFYNEETNSCEQIGYTGCSALGFETKQECENCECR